MLNKKALAGTPSTPPVYVEDVFSTYLYTGTGATQTITNGIDLSTKGGLVWAKSRSNAYANCLTDTVRGNEFQLVSNNTDAQLTGSPAPISSFNTNGFSLPASTDANDINFTGSTYCSWTFREQAKFFDIVTYTGTGSATTISHNLGSVPGMIIVKAKSTTTDWVVYHRSAAASGYTAAQSFLRLNLTNAVTDGTAWNNTAPTSTVFSVGAGSPTNSNGQTYVAYLFAHDAGGFGAAGTDDVVMCGSYTGNGSATGPTVDLGFEPQYILIKGDIAAGNWFIFDNMRGIATGGNDPYLLPNSSAAESEGLSNAIDLNATGFQIRTTSGQLNNSGTNYIYMAIRRPMKTPTSGTEVLALNTWTGDATNNRYFNTGLTTDFFLYKARNQTYGSVLFDRLRGDGNYFYDTSTTDGEPGTLADFLSFTKTQTGVTAGNGGYGNINQTGYNNVGWSLRRATGFFDIVCYTGTGTQTAFNHNLGVAPEFVIIKKRDVSSTQGWITGTKFTSTDFSYALLNSNAAGGTYNYADVTTFKAAPTSTTITLGTYTDVNASGSTYVAYLFATVAGVSKVGSYTGNGSSQTINCGFTAGARFVLIKRTDSTGDWCVFDTARGIVSGNDPFLQLNSTAAEVTGEDAVDPTNSGFIVNETTEALNTNNATYIYLAIA